MPEDKAVSNIFHTVVTITLFSVVDQIGGFIYTIILSRSIGAAGIGMYQIALGIVNVIVAISASGLPFVLGRRVAECRALGDKRGEDSATTAGLMLSTILSFSLALFFLLGQNVIAAIYRSSQVAAICILLLPAALANCFYATFRGSLWGKKEYVAHSSLEIFEIIFRIALALLLFQCLFTSYEGTLRAAMVYSITCVSTALLSFAFYKIKKGGFASPKSHIKPIVKSAIPVSGIRIAGNLFQTVIAIIFSASMTKLAGYSVSDAMAEYGILNGMTLPLIAFPIIFVSAITTALVPIVSADMKMKKYEEVRRHLSQAINYSLLFGGLAIGLYMAFGEHLGTFIFNNSHVGAYLRVSAWIMIPLALSALTTNLQNSMGLEYHSLINYVIGGIVMLLSVWLLPRYVGAYSLIVATGAGMTIVALLNIRLMKRKIGLKSSFFKTLGGIALCSGSAAGLGFLSCNIFCLFASSGLSALTGCIISIVSFLILTFTFNIAGMQHMVFSFLQSIKQKRKRVPAKRKIAAKKDAITKKS